MTKIAYFIHDLTDAQVAKRIAMLRAGGAEVTPIGFRRSAKPVPQVAGIPAIDLGPTKHGELVRRLIILSKRALKMDRWREAVAQSDVILARNLEMLTLGALARRKTGAKATLAYESLDLHPAMVRNDIVGDLLRRHERKMLAQTDYVAVCGPAYLDQYFEAGQASTATSLIWENKIFDLNSTWQRPVAPRPNGPPWRIGWYGLIRCRRSLKLLKAIAQAYPGQIEVIIRGRPVESVFPDLNAEIADTPGMSFEGVYTAADLEAMYTRCHFNWAIDFAGGAMNTQLSLSNRLYEGGFFNTPALGQGNTASGRWLDAHNCGVVLNDPESEAVAFFGQLTQEKYDQIAAKAALVPSGDFAWSKADCAQMVETLRTPSHLLKPAADTQEVIAFDKGGILNAKMANVP